MNNYADLHIHSCYSDGTLTPEKILEEASKRKLHTIAITDHDTLSGSISAWKMADDHSVEVIIGIEFSCVYHGEDVHVLGYFLHDVSQAILPFLEELQQRRQERATKIMDRFNQLGIDMHSMDLSAYGDSIGRPHFAKELLRLGIVKTFDEAFAKYLKPGRPCYVEKTKISVLECTESIHNHGGVSVLAHPGMLEKEETLLDLLDYGPDGLEVYHPKHDQKDKIRLYNLAKEHDLLITGGSDFHEETKSRLTGIGSEKIPVRYVETLKQRIKENMEKQKV